MKRIAVCVCMAMLSVAVVARAQTPAPKPGAEWQKMAVFLGHWTYEGAYKPGPFGPGARVTGEETLEMVLGGFFIQGRWVEKRASGELRGLEIFGYNPATKNYPQSQYTDDGGMASGAMTVSGNTWNLLGEGVSAGKSYRSRYTMTFAADAMSMGMKTELSTDGNSWTPFGEFTFSKVPKPGPKK